MTPSQVSKLIAAAVAGEDRKFTTVEVMAMIPAARVAAGYGTMAWAAVARLASTSEVTMSALCADLSSQPDNKETDALYKGAQKAIKEVADRDNVKLWRPSRSNGSYSAVEYDPAAAIVAAKKKAAAKEERERQAARDAAIMLAHEERVDAAITAIIAITGDAGTDPSLADRLEHVLAFLQALESTPAVEETAETAETAAV